MVVNVWGSDVEVCVQFCTDGVHLTVFSRLVQQVFCLPKIQKLNLFLKFLLRLNVFHLPGFNSSSDFFYFWFSLSINTELCHASLF